MLRRLLQTSVRAALTVVLGTAVLFWFASPLFVSCFIKDSPEALACGTRAARCYAVGMPFYGLNLIYNNYITGRGKNRQGMLLSMLSEGGCHVAAALALFPLTGVDAVLCAFPTGQALLLVINLVIVALANRRLHRRPADLWERILLLPDDFDVPEKDRIDRTITGMDEVVPLSEAVWQFCEDHGCDARRKYALSLAVEELAVNTLQTGFRPGVQNSIDMRILKKGGEYILRVRDDCEIFDPVRQLRLYDSRVPLHHIGLQMAMASARDVQYTTVLRLNNLVLRL